MTKASNSMELAAVFMGSSEGQLAGRPGPTTHFLDRALS